MKPSRIFVTHSSHDATTATKIRDYLESNGIQCWMAPRDIPVGEEWAKGILNGINTASGMLLVFSSNSNDSSQVRREIERAIHNNIAIYPVRIEDVQPSDAMEYYISSNHWMDAFGGNFETNLDKLVKAIKSKQASGMDSQQPKEEPAQGEPKQELPSLAVKKQQRPKLKPSLPKFSFKISKKILFPIAFFLLLVAGYFISKSFESSNFDTIIAEEIAPLPSDTINTFVRMIASTDEFGDYVADIKVTEDGNYVIMGYSYVNDDYYDGKPWIAMFDSIGNEIWKHEGSILGGEGKFDIYPDGRSVWAYPMVDTTLWNNRSITYMKEYLSSSGEVILSAIPPIWNSNPYNRTSTNLPTFGYGFIRSVLISDSSVYVATKSSFAFQGEISSDHIMFGERDLGDFEGLSCILPQSDYFVTEFSLHDEEFTMRQNVHRLLPTDSPFYSPSSITNIQIVNENLYCASLGEYNVLSFLSWSQKISETDSLLSKESRCLTSRIPENILFDELQELFLILTDDDEFYVISLLPDYYIYCFKLDIDGNIIWLKKFETRSNSDALFNATFIDNAIFLCGVTYSVETESFDGYLMKMDLEGNVLWERTYDFGGTEDLWGVEGTEDGGLVLVLESDVHGTSDVFLLKTDSLGNIPEYCANNNVFLFEDWSSVETTNNWIKRHDRFWNLSSRPEFGDGTYLSVAENKVGYYEKPVLMTSGISISIMMGSLGYISFQSTQDYIRYGLFENNEIGTMCSLHRMGITEFRFPIVKHYDFDQREWVSNEEKAWFHWDYASNSSFESCGRIGVGYFNGDSIVVGRIEPDTAWVEFGVLNDFEIKINGNSADYFINDSLFFHTDEFVCDSDSLYLYLAGASNTIPNAIGEVRVTSE